MAESEFYSSADEIVADYDNGTLKETYPLLYEAIRILLERRGH